jgi:hypothetical protein
MNHHALTLLILKLNSLVDSGKYDDITIREVHKHIKDGTILRFLQARVGADASLRDLLGTEPYGDFQGFYLKELQSLYECHGGNESRKWGVEKKGLCLLIAWTNEILQQGTGRKPKVDGPPLRALVDVLRPH